LSYLDNHEKDKKSTCISTSEKDWLSQNETF